MRGRATAALAIVFIVSLLAASLLVGSAVRAAHAATTATAPTFTIPDIYGHPFSLSSYRGSDVVMIEFTSLSCSECQIVEKEMDTLYTGYNSTGTSNVAVLSVYTNPTLGDTVPALQSYHNRNNITWVMAQDTNSLAVSTAYGVGAIPDVFVIDKQGHAVYNVVGPQSTDQLRTTINSALKGTAPAIAIVTVSVFALAAIAGVTTFFSPCAFPMFPGYMSLFLGLNAGGAAAATAPGGGTYKGAARRAVLAGSATAFGMIVVFLVVGVALILAASAITGYIPDLLVVVGAVLIGLGALLLTNLQYWKIVSPFQALWRRVRGASSEPAAIAAPVPGERLHLKLFGYGMGYAAAAAGCVAPVIFSAIIAGLALGLVGGIVTVLIYSVTAAVLMIVVTVLLAVASRRFVNQLKAATPIIKKVSAVVLIAVGTYLIYYFYTAWVA